MFCRPEKDLQRLLSEPSLRQKIAQHSAPAITPDGIDLSPTEKAEVLLGVRFFDKSNIRSAFCLRSAKTLLLRTTHSGILS